MLACRYRYDSNEQLRFCFHISKLTVDEVRDYCRGRIARYKIPKYVFFVDEYPLTGSGKIQKFKLRDLSLKLCAEQGIEVI